MSVMGHNDVCSFILDTDEYLQLLIHSTPNKHFKQNFFLCSCDNCEEALVIRYGEFQYECDFGSGGSVEKS